MGGLISSEWIWLLVDAPVWVIREVVDFLIKMKYKPHKRQIISWLLTNTNPIKKTLGLEPPFSTKQRRAWSTNLLAVGCFHVLSASSPPLCIANYVLQS